MLNIIGQRDRIFVGQQKCFQNWSWEVFESSKTPALVLREDELAASNMKAWPAGHKGILDSNLEPHLCWFLAFVCSLLLHLVQLEKLAVEAAATCKQLF